MERVLDIATLNPNQLKIKSEKIHIHKVIEELENSFQLKLEEKSGGIKLNLSAEKDIIEGDPFHLSNVFNNLIDNAIKYCSGKPNVRISSFLKGEKIHVSVKDNGIGIEKKHQKMIFERFFRVPKGNIHDVKGFGLGLFYVKSIVEEMEGKILLKNSDSDGSEFVVIFRISKL